MISYADALAKTGYEKVETTVRKRKKLFVGFVTRINNESDGWGSGGGKGLLGRARTALNALSRA